MIDKDTQKMFSRTKEENLICNIMESYPEADYGNALKCISWDYNKCEFEFKDIENNSIIYNLSLSKLKKGFKLMLNDMWSKKINSFNYIDEGNWDGETLDMLIQYSIFGKLIYG